MKTALVLTLAMLSQAAGNTLLSKGMKQVASTQHSWLPTLMLALTQPSIWMGGALLTAFFVLYAASLSWADLSFVLPATSFGYVLNVASAHYFLSEPVSAMRWGGTLVIVAGVLMVSRSGVRPSEVRDTEGAWSRCQEERN